MRYCSESETWLGERIFFSKNQRDNTNTFFVASLSTARWYILWAEMSRGEIFWREKPDPRALIRCTRSMKIVFFVICLLFGRHPELPLRYRDIITPDFHIFPPYVLGTGSQLLFILNILFFLRSLPSLAIFRYCSSGGFIHSLTR